MTIKIVHTADNHIGMKFNSYPPEVKAKLVQERFNALKNIVVMANSRAANFLVVAGDLFDTINVSMNDIKEVISVLNGFTGDAVIVLPGNHDFFDVTPNSLWDKFRKNADSNKIYVLDQYEPFQYNIGEQKVVFYPASCRSKHSDVNMIGWIGASAMNSEAINIGLAHGNVTGLGLDQVDKYFNMSPEELKQAGVDFWLLGHIHVPFPKTSVNYNPDFFMPATHTPDGMDRKHRGSCWYIEVDPSKNIKGDLIQTGNLGFYDWEKKISSMLDFDKLLSELKELDHNLSLVRLELTGRLSHEELQQINTKLKALNDSFLYFTSQNFIKVNIDIKYVDANYTKDSLPHKLLSSLINESESGLELQLANELIESLKS